MSHSPPSQLIRPSAKRNALVFCLAAAGLLCLALILRLLEVNVHLVGWVALLVSAAFILLLGVAKLLEPEVSLLITPSELTFYQRRGFWRLGWDDILRFDVPRVHRGLQLEDLPYIAFRLRTDDAILKTISPRLAAHLILEQRHLIVLALRHEAPDRTDYTEYFDVPDKYVSDSGTVYTGVLAMFATRMQQLRELLGYDLYVSANALDRPLPEFRQFLQELQRTRNEALRATDDDSDPINQ